ncbi:hypothetical protein FE257_010618 [Aspergillus nanangensis]|uniref:Carboxylesterase type B domain-containing protein n=1 Tax=Aspergillus nanangensis TaxID=2582783 RepID=A0AAD4CIP3_ASPNN|nr:hypothetical protein FE257_010618 [Aspergillus nanangensis]
METPPIEIQLPSGAITALQEEGLIHARGIPYAEAERFQPPKPLTKWHEVVDCTKPAAICPQRPSRLNFVTGDLVQGQPMSEHCLNLSIIAPSSALDHTGTLPVMVWFHGGAFLSGGGDFECYKPRGLASRGIVVINVTHRLGIVGYLEMEGIAPANLGLLDQIAALRWVQKNVSFIGGDPTKITVVGQSAGSQSIYCMMISDDTAGLFQRAILQSTPLGKSIPDEEIARKLSTKAKALLGENASTVSTEELLDIQTKVIIEAKRLGIDGTGLWPQFGRAPLPEISVIPQRLQQAAQQYKILIGWTKDEGSCFVDMMPNPPPWFRYPLVGPLLRHYMISQYTCERFARPSQQFHHQFLQDGGDSSTYFFKWSPPGSRYGATHCIELPFLLGPWSAWSEAPMVKGPGSQCVVDKRCRVRHLKCDTQLPTCIACKQAEVDCDRSFNVRFRQGLDLDHNIAHAFPGLELWLKPTGPFIIYDETPAIQGLYHVGISQSICERDNVLEDIHAGLRVGEIDDSLVTLEHAIPTTPVGAAPDNLDEQATHFQISDLTPEPNIHYSPNNNPSTGASSEGHFLPAKQVTPFSEREATLMRNFVENMALWADVTDPQQHFAVDVPSRALREPILRFAIFAFSSQHINRQHNANIEEALNYHNQCLQLLIPILSGQGELNDVIFATVAILRQLEEMDCEDKQFHLTGTTHLLNAVSSSGLSGGLSEAAAWLCLREDIHISLTSQKPLKTYLQGFSSSDVFTRNDDYAWANKMVFLLAKLLKYSFHYGGSTYMASLRSIEQEIENWNIAKPHTFDPIKFIPRGKEPYRRLPDIWMLLPVHGSPAHS